MPTQNAMHRTIDPSPTAKVVIGSIGVLYGTVRLLTALVSGLGPAPADSPGYQTGQILGLVVAAAVLYFGARYVRRGLAERELLKAGRSLSESPESVDAPDSISPPRS